VSVDNARAIDMAENAAIARDRTGLTIAGRSLRDLIDAPPLFVRYVIVSGVIGLPASIAQLTVMRLVWGHYFGGPGLLTLNALWVLNFELGLVRNYALHCLYTWRVVPSWKSLRHAHVAATGAIIIDIIAFNVVVCTTHIVPLAQVFGASSGFGLNFFYNKFLTFRRERAVPVEVVP
jgi:putative flippase GtrA